MSISTVPVVLPALYSRAVGALPDWQVVKGPSLNNLKQRYALIGHNPEGSDVEADQTVADLAVRNGMESYSVYNQFTSWFGGNDFDQVCDDVYSALSAVSSLFETDPQLGGTCMLAQLSTHGLKLARGNNRVQANLTWIVSIQAFRTV